MLAKVKTAAVVGLDAQEVEVEVDIMGGLPAMKEADRSPSLPVVLHAVLSIVHEVMLDKGAQGIKKPQVISPVSLSPPPSPDPLVSYSGPPADWPF